MEYMLDNEGYIMHVFFGCSNDSSIVYAGELPAGYESIEEWAENENINSWTIVNGNLAYDASRDQTEQEQQQTDHQNNRHISYAELQEALANTSLTEDEISFILSNAEAMANILPVVTAKGKVILLTNASNNNVQSISLTTDTNITGSIKLIFNGKNIFKNNATSAISEGIAYTVGADKKITINGTPTGDSELIISGTSASTVPIFVLKKDVNYYLESLPEGVNIVLYENDGTGLNQVYAGNGGTVLSFSADQTITYAVLKISAIATLTTENGDILTTEAGDTIIGEGSSSTTYTNTVASLMLSVGNTSVAYEKYQEQTALIALDNNTFTSTDTITVDENGNVALIKPSQTIQLETITMPQTFNGFNTVYATKDTTIELEYKKAGFDYTRVTGNGILKLNNTAEGLGSIHNLAIADLTAGGSYILKTSDGGSNYETYTLDLSSYTGTVSVIITDGKAEVFRGETSLGSLDDIYITTYKPTTYIELLNNTNAMLCDYMVESEFSVFCTRVEKDASIKILQDSISLIVSSNGNVTPASIIAAINDNESSVKISADNIDIAGTTFPTIRNTAGTCVVNTLAQQGIEPAIAYTAPWHNFSGGDVYIDEDVWIEKDSKLGKLSSGYLMYVEPSEQKVTIANGSLEIDLNLFADGVVGLGTKDNHYALRIDADGDIRIRGNVTIDGDLTVGGTINN